MDVPIFQSTRPSQTSTSSVPPPVPASKFQSTRPSQTSTGRLQTARPPCSISIHEAFADLDHGYAAPRWRHSDFNPRGLRRPRRHTISFLIIGPLFQSTRPSQTSTYWLTICIYSFPISIHEAFADLDLPFPDRRSFHLYFNPRGLRRPRRILQSFYSPPPDFNPRGLRRPRRQFTRKTHG